MSEPITLYGPEPFEGVVRWVVAGIFEERAWCATHDVPFHPKGMYNTPDDPSSCFVEGEWGGGGSCEMVPRLVQKGKE